MEDYMSDSGSDDEEVKEHETEASADLKSGKLKASNVDGTLKCPFCVSKKKQDYKYHELLAHASGQGKSKRGNLVMVGQHRALASYLQNELKDLAKPAAPRYVKLEQAPPQRKESGHMFVHPWVALIYNIGTVESAGKRTSPGAGELKEQFQKFNPDQVKAFWDFRGSLGMAAITFRKDLQGYEDCRLLEMSFLEKHHGKNNYLKNKETRCLGTELYGWMATEDDYNDRGKVGEFLRDKFNLKTMTQLEDDKMRTHEHLRKQLQDTISAQNQMIANQNTENVGLRNKMEAAEQGRKIAELQRQIQEEKFKEELEAVKATAQQLIEKGRQDMEKKAGELESEMARLQELNKQLSIRESNNEAESKRLELEKLENERRMEEISKEMDLRSKQHNSSISMREKHENQNQHLAKEIQEMKMSLAMKQKREVEMQQVVEQLEAAKLQQETKEASESKEASDSSEKIKKLEEQLEEMQEEKEGAEQLVNDIVVAHREATDIVSAGKKAAVEAYDHIHGDDVVKTGIGIRRMGEIDDECWAEAFQKRFGNDEWELKMSKHVSTWSALIKKHDWCPYKPVYDAKGKRLEVVNGNEPKLKILRERFGQKVYHSVARALLEINKYNASGRYPVPTPWDFSSDKEASLADVIKHLEELLLEEREAKKICVKEKLVLQKEVKTLKAMLDSNGALEQSSGPTAGRGRGKRKKPL